MILEKKTFEDIEKYIPQDLYIRLINRKRSVVEEDRIIRENQIKKLCKINNDEDMKIILTGIESLLRNQKRTI